MIKRKRKSGGMKIDFCRTAGLGRCALTTLEAMQMRQFARVLTPSNVRNNSNVNDVQVVHPCPHYQATGLSYWTPFSQRGRGINKSRHAAALGARNLCELQNITFFSYSFSFPGFLFIFFAPFSLLFVQSLDYLFVYSLHHASWVLKSIVRDRL